MDKKFRLIFIALAIFTLTLLFVGCKHTHEFNEMVSTDTFLNTPATCTQKATYFYSCKCGEKGTETFESGEMAQHNFNKQVATQDFFVAPASCTAKETYNYSCQCGAKGNETFGVGEMLSHALNTHHEANPASCGVDGNIEYYECDNCDGLFTDANTKVDTVIIPAPGHDWLNEIKKEEQLYLQQTCENPATYYQICSRCDEISQQQTFTVGETKPHNWIEDEDRIVLVSGATCQNLAKYEKVCSMCKFYPSDYDLEGEEYYFTYGGFADHSFTREVTEEKYFNAPASCTQKATYFYSCACGAKGTRTFETGEMEEHNFVLEVMEEKFLSTSATCDKKASYFYSCACGAKGTRTFETGDYVHNYNLQNTDAIYFSAHPNCNQKATYFYSCKCGAKGTETFEFGTVGDHDFANNQSCTVCQASYGLKYDMAEDNSGYIVSLGNCKDKDIVIPRYYNKTPVISIGENAFERCTNLTGIKIPDGIISIGSYAFSDCKNLTSITIPSSVSSIGDKAFYNCTNLISATISEGVITIGDSAFRNTKLTSITIPDSVTSIGKHVFNNCKSLKSIVIGKGVKTIGSNAFNSCTALTTVYYKGTSVGWLNITISSTANDLFIDATRYYFSETKPAVMGNYWHYDTDGKTPILW